MASIAVRWWAVPTLHERQFVGGTRRALRTVINNGAWNALYGTMNPGNGKPKILVELEFHADFSIGSGT